MNADSFWARVTPDDNGCWLWSGTKFTICGYGRVTRPIAREFGTQLAHRVAFQLINGPLRDDLLVCHRCDVKLCCNPSHLFAGTPKDNIQDSVKKGRRDDRKGERHPRAKLTAKDILTIRQRRERGELLSVLARDFGTSDKNISLIALRKAWAHV